MVSLPRDSREKRKQNVLTDVRQVEELPHLSRAAPDAHEFVLDKGHYRQIRAIVRSAARVRLRVAALDRFAVT